jgi:hypothetical protein
VAQFRHDFQTHDPTPLSSEEMLAGITDLYLHAVEAAPVSAPRK